ncbi:MAG: DUF6402 family protein [Azoarcus sp.]|nr:DUF6402 family protein [Azoarcus sp.]
MQSPCRSKEHCFRRWRNKHGAGGDFYVFSGVFWIFAPQIDSIEIIFCITLLPTTCHPA